MKISTNNEQKVRVLVVDDMSATRIVVKGILREIGLNNVDEAANGNIALQKMQKEEFDIIMTDWNMPHMSGLELLRKIREDDKLSRLPVLMVTSEAKKENVIEAAKAGASGYIIKPFSASTLNAKLNKIIHKIS